MRNAGIYIQNNPWRRWRKTMKEVLEFVVDLNVLNLKPALNIGHCIAGGEEPKDFINRVEIVLISAPTKDRFGQFYDTHSPIFSSEYKEVIKEALKSIEEKDSIKICLDGIYNNWDEVYRDISWLNKILISE